MNATDLLHLTNKLDMILKEVDDIKQMLVERQVRKYEELKEDLIND